MKYFSTYITVFILLLFSSCEEKADYETTNGPFIAFYPELNAEVLEVDEEELEITMESTGRLLQDAMVYVKVPADPSIRTTPAFDPFTKEIPVRISAETRRGAFTFQYLDNETEQETENIELHVVRTEGEINGSANGVYTVKVIDDDFTLVAPFTIDFNEGCAIIDQQIAEGWEVFSYASASQWECSPNGRGASGESGDYALEMDNFGGDEAAEDWLITPVINTASSNKIMSFNSLMRYEGSEVEIFYSTNYSKGTDPKTAEWIEIESASNAWDDNVNSWDFTASGDIDISDLPDEFNTCFQYRSRGTASGETGTARIDDFQIK